MTQPRNKSDVIDCDGDDYDDDDDDDDDDDEGSGALCLNQPRKKNHVNVHEERKQLN